MMDAPRHQISLEARDVTYGYRSQQTVLRDFSARFEPGTMTALTGPSGRGKSTLLYMLGLMLKPSHGEVIVGGEDTSRIMDSGRAQLRARLFGFVFQDAALDSTRSVLHNVVEAELYRGLDPKEASSRARSLLSRFGVDLPLDRKPGQVSGGQAQRIALCRALLGAPPILLADEPTGNLDPASSAVVVDAMRTHAQSGATVIVVTHSADVAGACDREISL